MCRYNSSGVNTTAFFPVEWRAGDVTTFPDARLNVIDGAGLFGPRRTTGAGGERTPLGPDRLPSRLASLDVTRRPRAQCVGGGVLV